MAAPVTFSISMGALPPAWSGDPQALLNKAAELLEITPSEPWSSFSNGGSQPSSNVGPWLKDGLEWWVYDEDAGTYTPHIQNGSGLVDATVSLAKLSDGTPKSVLSYAADGRPSLISGTVGQVVTADANGLPSFATPVTGQHFYLHLSTVQSVTADGTNQQIEFDQTVYANGVTPDLANYRIPVTAGSAWMFGVSLQIEVINGAHTGCQLMLNVRPYQDNSLAIGSFVNFASTTDVPRQGLQTSGIYYFATDGYVDVALSAVDDAAGVNYQVDTNGINTRFWGVRVL